MKYYFNLLFISLSHFLFSQINSCPIDEGRIISGYINNKDQQAYKGTFFKENPNILPVDITVLTDEENKNIKSIVRGKVFYVNENLIGISYGYNKLVIYSLLKNIIVEKGDKVEIGTIIGQVEYNDFLPININEILDYSESFYSVNLSFHYIDYEKAKTIHSPIDSEIVSCQTTVCEKCQPFIYGM